MTEMVPFKPGDALLIVDVQNDFCPGGALPVTGGDDVVPVLNRWIARARESGVPVIASRDWHPRDHASFTPQGGPWPEHCLQDSDGARFHPQLAVDEDTIIVSKGSRFDRDAYSAFDNTGLAEYLHQRGIKKLWLGGLALDVCVLHTALGAAEAGFETHLISDACRAVDDSDGAKALEQMRSNGIHIDE